jgi:hypothetical protein
MLAVLDAQGRNPVSSQMHSEIAIEATPERVWEVLTDFAAYPEWNSFIPSITGPGTVGSRLDLKMQPSGGVGMRLRPTVLAAAPAQELRWLGHLGVPGLFDGEHRFRIESLGADRVRFIQEERFSGLLAPLVLRFVERGTRQGFETMNMALKARAEQPTSSH